MKYVAQQDFSTGPDEAKVNYEAGAVFEMDENAESTQALVDAGTIIAQDLVNQPEQTIAGAGTVDETGVIGQKPFSVKVQWKEGVSEDEVTAAEELIKGLVAEVNAEGAIPASINEITISRL